MAEFYDEGIPFGFHITFRAYGTWLHGDERGSIDRFHNRYGTPRLPRNEKWKSYNRKILKQPPVKLKSRQRQIIENAIREVCKTRKWKFWVTNVRTNHVHTVVSALCKPERIRSALKANATKKLREGGCWRSDKSPWVRKGSIKWLWTEPALINAIAYVESDQGESLP
jgi:REP element-mobilizing transposase RayT